MKYLVLGGNAAGMSFAAKAKRNQPKDEIIVIEKRDYVSLGGCGLPYYVGGFVDQKENLLIRTPEQFRDNGIDLRINEEVIKVNQVEQKVEIKTKQGEIYEQIYDKLIVCTGASPIIFPGLKKDNQKIFTLTSLEDGVKLKEKINTEEKLNIAIIGSGFIGMELIDVLKEKKHQLHLITRDNYILAEQFEQPIVEHIQKELMQNNNVEMYFGQNIQNIEANNKIIIEMEKKLSVDIVILAMGFRPNTNFINVEKMPNGAIITDFYGKTSAANIYAIGDCATVHHYQLKKPTYIPLATVANKLGRMLADELNGIKTGYQGMIGGSVLKLNHYELAKVGLSKKDCDANNLNYKEKTIEDFNQTNQYPGQEKIKANILYDPKTLKILGVSMVGKKGVAGRIDALSIAIYTGLTTKQLGYIDFVYAPPISRTWDFLNVIGNVSK